MNRISSVLIGLTLLCAACSKSEKETPNGFKFTVITAGDGVLPKKEEVIVFDYQLKDSKDSVWNDTYTQGIPAALPIADSAAMPKSKRTNNVPAAVLARGPAGHSNIGQQHAEKPP